MVLNDKDIQDRVTKESLLEFHNPANIKYCGYELRIGSVLAPHTGEKYQIADKAASFLSSVLTSKKCFTVEPSEMVVIVTKEKVNVPNDLCATYGQLNRLSNQGLMILNTSIVEPGYKGPLSCVLVNFSSQRHALSQDESVAKLNFHKLSGAPSKPYPTSYDHNEYEKNAAKSATKLPKSLLDITGIEERITEKVGSTVRSRIILSGIIIAFLLLWSQLEGFFSGWIYQKTGIMTTKTQVELLLKQQQLDNQKENQQLREKIDGLEKRIADQDAAKKDRRSRQQ